MYFLPLFLTASNNFSASSSASKPNTDTTFSSKVPEGESKSEKSDARWLAQDPGQDPENFRSLPFSPTLYVMSDTASDSDDLGFDDPDETAEEKKLREE